MNATRLPPRIEVAQEPQAADPGFLFGDRVAVVETSPIIRAALDLYDLGFNIGPTKPIGKHPFRWRCLTTARIERESIPFMFTRGAGIFVVTGRLSSGLFILDCEADNSYMHHLAEFNRRGIKPWITQTADGAHFWLLSSEGEIANVKANAMPGGNAEIRGNTCYCLTPPSVHPTGMIYQWLQRETELPPTVGRGDLDWLPLELAIKARNKYKRIDRDADPFSCLSRRNREYIARGASEGQRNNRLYACACDMQGNEIDYNMALNVLLPRALQDGLTERESIDTIKSAYKEQRQPAKPATPKPIAPDPYYTKIRAWAEAHHFDALTISRGRKRSTRARSETVQRVMLALCERARRDDVRDNAPFRASTREVAELANVSRAITQGIMRALADAGYIKRIGSSVVGAGLFVWGGRCSSSDPLPPTGSVSSGSLLLHSDPSNDAFTRGALGENGARVWREILSKPARVFVLAQRLRLNRTTIERALKKLQTAGLASRAGRDWIGIAANDDTLTTVAGAFGTSGKSKTKRDGHQAQRSKRVTRQILYSKRRWERSRGWPDEEVAKG